MIRLKINNFNYMKRIYSLIVLIVFVLSFASCEDFMDVHKEYIEGGEIVYAPKPDTLSFIAGKERILFNCRTYNAPNVQSIDVYWNEGLDSLIIPVSLKTGYDSISVMLDNMEEKSYTFNVRTTDNYGYKSLFLTDFGTSYGDLYQSRMTDRRVKSISLSDKGGIINWYFVPAGLVRNEVRYVKSDDTQSIVALSSKKDAVELPDAKAGSFFEYRSLYIPEKQCVDTFATDWKKHETPFPDEYKYNTGSGEVLSALDESADHGGRIALLDDDLNTFWHSAYAGGIINQNWNIPDSKKHSTTFRNNRRTITLGSL